jgi:protoporphyrinogen oxidase
MMRRKKKTTMVQGTPGMEPTLYDLEKAEAEEPHTNGATPESNAVEYVETEDEGELRSLISNISDVLEELIDVPEWKVNGKVVQILLRALNAREYAQFGDTVSKPNADMANAFADMVIMTARHPKTRKLLFKPADRAMLHQRLGRAVQRIAIRAAELSGVDEKTLNEMKKK